MKNASMLLAGLVAALAASACCILPLLLGVASAGSIGLGAALAPYRTCFIVLSAVLLGLAFYVSYRPQKAGSETECCDAKAVTGRRMRRAFLWVAAVFAVAAMAYPGIAAYRTRLAELGPQARVPSTSGLVLFSIRGLTCRECAAGLEKALSATPGVYAATVDFTAGRAAVRFDAHEVGIPALRQAVERAGFHVSAVKGATSGSRAYRA